jgi:hypothetical protein
VGGEAGADWAMPPARPKANSANAPPTITLADHRTARFTVAIS